MFAMCARVAPACGRESSLANFTCSDLSFVSTDTPLFSGSDREPLAPFTVTAWFATEAVTPCGRSMILLATRDMVLLTCQSSGDDAEHFAALADGTGLLVRHHTLGGRDDDGAHAAEHLRQFVLATIDAQPRTGDALEAVDHRPAFVIFEADGERGLAAIVADAEVFHVTLVLQHAHDGRLHLR